MTTAQPSSSANQLDENLVSSLVSSEVLTALTLVVQHHLTNGLSNSKIIKDVLGYKAEKYQQGRAILDEIKRSL